MKRRFGFFGVLLLILCNSLLHATGPSHLLIGLTPVSLNARGALLCKTVFLANTLGISGFVPITYGWAVIEPSGLITRYPWLSLDPYEMDSDEQIIAEYEMAYQTVHSPIDFSNPPASLKHVLSEYGFSAENTGEFLVNQTMSYMDFIEAYKLDRDSMMQFTINEGHSLHYYDSVLVAYDFGSMLILRNTLDPVENTLMGAKFGFGDFGEEEYDSYSISGVVFLR